MRSILIGLALLFVACQPLFSQDAKSKESAAGIVLADPAKLANIQLDLLLEQRKTLEALADWLKAENKAFQLQITAWEKSRSELQEHLNGVFACEFDMDARACKPKPEEKPKP